MAADTHVIFGTGALARAVMRALIRRGVLVRMVNRSGARPEDIPEEVEIIAGDSSDPAFTRAVTDGAQVVYQCAQPPYSEWVEKFPPLQAAILAGAAANGARLIAGENTYMYGDVDGQPMTEGLPLNPHTRKGKVRAAMTEALFEAHRLGQVRMAAARGSDFFGPGVLGSTAGERVFGFAVQGKAAQFTGRLDLPHTYTFIDDFGEAMAILGENDRAMGQAWHVPSCQPRITQREFGQLIFQALGTEPKIASVGKFMMRIGGLFVPDARESVEMMYEFEKPFVVDHSKFAEAFGDISTPLEESIPATVAWYREHLDADQSA